MTDRFIKCRGQAGCIFFFHGCHLLTFLSVIFLCSITHLFPWEYTKHYFIWDLAYCPVCSVMFFLYAVSLITRHHFPRLSPLSFRMFRMFSLTVRLSLSTSPWVDGVRGAPWTCLILCFLHSSLIVLLLNSFPLSECRMDGKSNIQNRFVYRARATSSVCLFFKAITQEYLLK